MQDPERVVWTNRGDTSLQALRDTLQKYRVASETDSEARKAVLANHFQEHAGIISQTIAMARELQAGVVPEEAVRRLEEVSEQLVRPLREASGAIARSREEYAAALKFQPLFELSAAVDALWESALGEDRLAPRPAGGPVADLAGELLLLLEAAGGAQEGALRGLRAEVEALAAGLIAGRAAGRGSRAPGGLALSLPPGAPDAAPAASPSAPPASLAGLRARRLAVLSKAMAGLAKIHSSTYSEDSGLPEEVRPLVARMARQREDLYALVRKYSSSLSPDQLRALLRPAVLGASVGEGGEPDRPPEARESLRDLLSALVEQAQLSAEQHASSAVPAARVSVSPLSALVLEAKTRGLFSRKASLFFGVGAAEFCELVSPCLSEAIPGLDLSSLAALEWDRRPQTIRLLYGDPDEDALLQELARLLLIAAHSTLRFRAGLLVLSLLARSGALGGDEGAGAEDPAGDTADDADLPGTLPELWPGLDWAEFLSWSARPAEEGPYAAGAAPDASRLLPLSFHPPLPSARPALCLLDAESRFGPLEQRAVSALLESYFQKLDYVVSGVCFLWNTFSGEHESPLARALCKEVVGLVLAGALQFFCRRDGSALMHSRAQREAFSRLSRWIRALVGLRPSPIDQDLSGIKTAAEAAILGSLMDAAAVAVRGSAWLYALVRGAAGHPGERGEHLGRNAGGHAIPARAAPSPPGPRRHGGVGDAQACRDFLAGVFLARELESRAGGWRAPFSPNRETLLQGGAPAQEDLGGVVLSNIDALVRHVALAVDSWGLAGPAHAAAKRTGALRLQWCYVDVVRVIAAGNYRGVVQRALDAFPDLRVADVGEGEWLSPGAAGAAGIADTPDYASPAAFLSALLRDAQLFASNFHPFFLAVSLHWLGFPGAPRLPPNFRPLDSVFSGIYNPRVLAKLTADDAFQQLLGPEVYATYAECTARRQELQAWDPEEAARLDSLPELLELEASIQWLLGDIAARVTVFDFEGVSAAMGEQVTGLCAGPGAFGQASEQTSEQASGQASGQTSGQSPASGPPSATSPASPASPAPPTPLAQNRPSASPEGVWIAGQEFRDREDVALCLAALLVESLREDLRPTPSAQDALRELSETLSRALAKGRPVCKALYPDAAPQAAAAHLPALQPQLRSRLRAELLPSTELARLIDAQVRACALLSAHVASQGQQRRCLERAGGELRESLRGLLARSPLEPLPAARAAVYAAAACCLVFGRAAPEELGGWALGTPEGGEVALGEAVPAQVLACAVLDCASVHAGPLAALGHPGAQGARDSTGAR